MKEMDQIEINTAVNSAGDRVEIEIVFDSEEQCSFCIAAGELDRLILQLQETRAMMGRMN